jgi:hypothetical protein
MRLHGHPLRLVEHGILRGQGINAQSHIQQV